MTTDANRVTARASAGAVPPTLTAATVRAMLSALERLGHDGPSLLGAVGLRPSDVDDPDSRISCLTMGALLGLAQQRRPIPNLDLRLAMETPLGAYPLLDYLIVTSSTVGEGMRRLATHAQLTGAPVRVELREDETPIRIVMEGSPYSTFLCALHLRREAVGALIPEYLSFREVPDDAASIEETLGCPVRVGASWSGLALSADAWRLPMRRRDPILQGVLERHAADILARLPGGTDVVSELRRVLARGIAGGSHRLSDVARQLGTSVRTLQRRLESAGVSYQEVLEQARCDEAERHLAEGSLTIAEVSWLVGYSEPSAFHRAFKRWRGLSPRSFRERERGRSGG